MYDVKVTLKDKKTKKSWNTLVRCADKMTHKQLCDRTRDAIELDVAEIAINELIEEGILPESVKEEIENGLTVPALVANKKVKTQYNEKYSEVLGRISFEPADPLPEGMEFPFKEELFETKPKKKEKNPFKTKEDYKRDFMKTHFQNKKG